eukprot:489295-Pyramimonas_sp.AAC.1
MIFLSGGALEALRAPRKSLLPAFRLHFLKMPVTPVVESPHYTKLCGVMEDVESMDALEAFLNENDMMKPA